MFVFETKRRILFLFFLTDDDDDDSNKILALKGSSPNKQTNKKGGAVPACLFYYFVSPSLFLPFFFCAFSFFSGIREKTSTRDSRDFKNVLRIHVSKKHARCERSLSGARVERQGGSSNKTSRSIFFRFFFLLFTAVRWDDDATPNRLLVLVSRANRAVSRARDGHIFTLVTEMGTSRFCSSQSGRENVSVSSRVSACSARADGKTSSGHSEKKPQLFSRTCTFRLSILFSLKFRLQSPRFAWLKTKT